MCNRVVTRKLKFQADIQVKASDACFGVALPLVEQPTV